MQNSYFVPGWELSIATKKIYRDRIVNVVRQIMKNLGIASDLFEMSIRKIEAGDIGLKSWITPSQKKFENTNWIDFQVPNDKVYVFYKVVILDSKPKIDHIMFYTGYSLNLLFRAELYELYSVIPVIEAIKFNPSLTEKVLAIYGGVDNLICEGWTCNPIVYQPQSRIHINIASKEDNFGNEIVLVGFVGEPTGTVLCKEK
jgi:hypothetical protein